MRTIFVYQAGKPSAANTVMAELIKEIKNKRNKKLGI
jgi:hypothetical protein